jgi:ABC-2 type transport system ATP-binding protein
LSDHVAIEVHGLTRRYGDLVAVDHISFQVLQGDIFGFLGPNGAGKTTTIRMLTTLLEPTEGTARINGCDILHQAYRAKHQFGIVPEESNIYTELSAWDNLMFVASLYRVPRRDREERARELLATFGLQEKRDVKVQFFSRGMRRRLTIAMALIHRPAVLFLDEPLAGLDAQSARAIRALVHELNDGGTTIFLTTHQIEVASQLCHRVAIIDHGRIAAIDTPEHLKRAIQSVQSVEVTLDHWENGHREGLAHLPGVSTTVREGSKVRLYTDDPPALLEEVMRFARERDGRVMALNTLGPSLEDVFLKITGQEVGTVHHGPGDADRGPGRRGKGRR